MTAPTVPAVAVDPELTRKLQRAAEKARTAKAALDELVVEAAAAGGSYREIAKLVGSTHPTIAKIVADAGDPCRPDPG